MKEEHRSRVEEAIWKAICTARTNLRHEDWDFSDDDARCGNKFSQADADAISKRLYERVSDTDFGRGENAYWQYLQAFEFVGSVMWDIALSVQMDIAKSAICSSDDKKERFDPATLRRAEAYLIEHIVRKGVPNTATEKVGRIHHVTA